MSLEDGIFYFNLDGKKKEYNFYKFDTFDDIRKKIIEDYNLDENILLTFDFPPQYNQYFQINQENICFQENQIYECNNLLQSLIYNNENGDYSNFGVNN